MYNPNGSDVPGARDLIEEVIKRGKLDDEDSASLHLAYQKLFRQKPRRRSEDRKRPRITPMQKAGIRALAGRDDLTNADIAVAVGLDHSDSGRVSEVLSGLR